MKLFPRIFLLLMIPVSFTIVKAQSFTNPILAGYYPDPSICRAGDDYYLVNSSFAYYPGLPLFHSRDLLNWKPIGFAMNRPEQLNLDSAGVSRGLFAPAISYHKGLFYIVCTEVSKLGNFVITAKDPHGPWSLPVKLPQVNGIDPSLFFDDTEKAYIVYNSIPPDNIPLHDGHRTIRMFGFDAANLKVTGGEKLLVNGGTDMAKKPVWIEGPHLFKKDGWYYLVCAEGGTGSNHSEVVFRSNTAEGPFVSYDKNPILTQRHLDPSRKNPITSTGHADFVETKDGKWWSVFLGCRPYEDDYYNTGRETFMAPVKWINGWPEFDLGGDVVKYAYPINAIIDKKRELLNGNYLFHDEFNSNKLSYRYQFLRTVHEQWYDLNRHPGSLIIKLRSETCAGKGNPSFIGFHQPHLKGYVSTSLNFDAKSSNEKAGLLLFQNERHYYYLCKSTRDGRPVIELYKDTTMITSRIISEKSKGLIFLKAEAKAGYYSFYFGSGSDKWMLLAENLDGKYLSTKSAGGFVGCFYSMYVTSGNDISENAAQFNWFEVKNNDDNYH